MRHHEIIEDNLAARESFAEYSDEPIVMINLMQVRSQAKLRVLPKSGKRQALSLIG